jgi:hypothetical protein
MDNDVAYLVYQVGPEHGPLFEARSMCRTQWYEAGMSWSFARAKECFGWHLDTLGV